MGGNFSKKFEFWKVICCIQSTLKVQFIFYWLLQFCAENQLNICIDRENISLRDTATCITGTIEKHLKRDIKEFNSQLVHKLNLAPSL